MLTTFNDADILRYRRCRRRRRRAGRAGPARRRSHELCRDRACHCGDTRCLSSGTSPRGTGFPERVAPVARDWVEASVRMESWRWRCWCWVHLSGRPRICHRRRWSSSTRPILPRRPRGTYQLEMICKRRSMRPSPVRPSHWSPARRTWVPSPFRRRPGRGGSSFARARRTVACRLPAGG